MTILDAVAAEAERAQQEDSMKDLHEIDASGRVMPSIDCQKILAQLNAAASIGTLSQEIARLEIERGIKMGRA